VNCNQARTLLSAYRELKTEEFATAELDAHLEECAACREALASYALIGEQMRSAPLFAPPPEMHAKLMRALADEQLKFLQKSAPGKVSTPEFLKPYLQERAEETQTQDEIAAFSTAETGPLPIIQARRKRRPVRVNQLGILGLAAAILMMLMMGGLTSLLVVAHNNPASLSGASNSINQPTEVNQKIYTTKTLYPTVTSALPAGNSVYYSAFGMGATSANWMIMQFDRGTQASKPLLAAPSTDPLVVLSASNSWLVWLQLSQPQARVHTDSANSSPVNNQSTSQRTWSLHYLSLLPQPANATSTQTLSTGNNAAAGQQTSLPTTQKDSITNQPALANLPTDVQLEQGVFDSLTAPSWIATPVQGTWLIGDTLLVAQIDQQGISHVESYLLGQTGKVAQAQTIANAPAGHVLAWPTADSTGMEMYWADEWTTKDGVLHSNIWQQQIDTHTVRYHGYPLEVDTPIQQLYLGDGMSFQPQVVGGTLFLLSTSEIKVAGQGVVTPNGTPFPASATDTSVAFTPRTDTGVYAAPADASVHGTIFMIPQAGLDVDAENTLGTVGQSTGFHSGSDYVIWQDTAGYQMYDVQRQANVTLGNTLNTASLLVVNGNTTFWLARGKSTPGQSLTMLAFNWPN
jgi:hypothetical protein